MSRYLVLDLETVGIDNAADFIQKDDIEAPSNYKNPQAIAAYQEREFAKRVEAAALDLDLARICAVGLMADGAGPQVLLAKNEQQERDVLVHVAGLVGGESAHQLITFNGLKYDMPLLMRRARYLGVSFPRLSVDRFRSSHVDLYNELTLNGSVKAHSLRWYMRRNDWTDLLSADPLAEGGASVAAAVAEGRWDDVAAHCRVDVEASYRLAAWLGYLPKDAVL